jgi:hypothetical protein
MVSESTPRCLILLEERPPRQITENQYLMARMKDATQQQGECPQCQRTRGSRQTSTAAKQSNFGSRRRMLTGVPALVDYRSSWPSPRIAPLSTAAVPGGLHRRQPVLSFRRELAICLDRSRPMPPRACSPVIVVEAAGAIVSSAPAGPPCRPVDDGRAQAASLTLTAGRCTPARSTRAPATSSTSPDRRKGSSRARWPGGAEAFSRANHNRGRRRSPAERSDGSEPPA